MNNLILPCFFLLLSIGLNAQTQDAEIGVDGIVIPQLDHTTITSPSLSQLIFDSNTNTYWYYNGTSWIELVSSISSSPSNKIQDNVDGDTNIEAIENGADDYIRIKAESAAGEMQIRTSPLGDLSLEFINATTASKVSIGRSAGFSNSADGKRNVFVGQCL